MIFGIPLAIILGFLTLISLLTTFSFGIAMHFFHKNVFRFHVFFAFLTIFLVIIHAILAFLLWYYGIVL